MHLLAYESVDGSLPGTGPLCGQPPWDAWNRVVMMSITVRADGGLPSQSRLVLDIAWWLHRLLIRTIPGEKLHICGDRLLETIIYLEVNFLDLTVSTAYRLLNPCIRLSEPMQTRIIKAHPSPQILPLHRINGAVLSQLQL